MKILVVDDHPTNLEIIQVLLGRAGHTVLTAINGEEGVAVAREQMPELVFMDLSMPGDIDGLEATRRLKGDPLTSGIVVVALTAMVKNGDVAQARDAGCDDFVRKPYTRKQLLALIDRHVAGHTWLAAEPVRGSVT